MLCYVSPEKVLKNQTQVLKSLFALDVLGEIFENDLVTYYFLTDLCNLFFWI